ncbi:F0F1 ATP synthase subunit epsilon [Stakelama tenebrarum]|uniref:ATP synthase epsilon chain n=1 Tax=Stakelama tenebrarum TaxID=2711215 RepID=A0A6G6Y230_9SPHN|nr:F0F1 ATP synthase subunit epsilon [Sphingosinithalassobacter tenebrarum]QIG78867.1 F0F1 ATP synthase subunit epsilon [Sphingosinithalassobacter tenebrarum]
MTLYLTIATPTEIAVPRGPVYLVRGDDESGSFGIMAGHLDMLTVMQRAVLRWRTEAEGPQRFCAVHGALFVVRDGEEVEVSAREAHCGDDLARLEREIASARTEEKERARGERVDAMRLHARAVRSLVAHLRAPGATEIGI